MLYRYILFAILLHSISTKANDLNFFSSTFNTKPLLPFPGMFSKFYGEVQYGNATIYWKLYEQGSNNKFFIERSENGNDYKELDSVSSIDGINFSYKDTIPLSTGFYRIKAIGKDTIYSDIMRLSTISGIPKVKVWPVLFDVVLNVEINSNIIETFTAVLTNSKGEEIISKEVTVEKGSSKIVFDNTISFLYPDEYTLTVTGLQYSYNQKLFKK